MRRRERAVIRARNTIRKIKTELFGRTAVNMDAEKWRQHWQRKARAMGIKE